MAGPPACRVIESMSGELSSWATYGLSSVRHWDRLSNDRDRDAASASARSGSLALVPRWT
jgi:hypothetical protein